MEGILSHGLLDSGRYTILRWAALTEKLSKQEVKAGKVLDLLLEESLPEREVYDVRKLFIGDENLTCVWTGESVGIKGFDIDHAIPFSLWHNNDLWNLFPVKSSVNRSKTDKLPSRKLIMARKKSITDTWERSFDAYPIRFEAEITLFSGTDIVKQSSWTDRLFTFFAEAMEVTAIQRGAERWKP